MRLAPSGTWMQMPATSAECFDILKQRTQLQGLGIAPWQREQRVCQVEWELGGLLPPASLDSASHAPAAATQGAGRGLNKPSQHALLQLGRLFLQQWETTMPQN